MARNEIRLQEGILYADHMTKIRAAARTPKERAIIEVLATCRRAEAALLRWGDLRLEEGLAMIQRGKGGLASWTLLLGSTREALAAWYADAGSPAPETWVFPVPGSGQPGKPYTPGGLAKIVQGILTRAGCWAPGMGCAHRFRRSFASAYMLENPSDLTGLSRLMRHRQLSTTMRYVFYRPTDLSDRMGRVKL